MKRRAVLLIGTSLALMLAFGLYRLLAPSVRGRGLPPPATHPAPQVVQTTPGGPSGGGDDLHIEARDDEGRLEAVYRASTWQRLEDGTIVLQEPRIQLLQRDGQEVHIAAEKGEIYAQEVGRRYRVQRGKLEGNVRVRIDRSTSQNRTDLSERPQDEILIRLGDVQFSTDLLELSSDGEVRVHSVEADVEGTGLLVRWNERPRELRDLQLVKGRRLVIRNVPEDFAGMSLPGASTAPVGPGGAPARAGAGAESPRPVPIAAPTVPMTRAGTETPGADARAAGGARNVYQAEFTAATGDIQVVFGDRRMSGAKLLSLIFQWQGSDEDRPASSRRGSAVSQPASGPSGAATPAAAPPGAAAAARTPATSRTPTASAPRQEPMTVTWQGPLVLRPVGRVKDPSRRNYSVAGSGDRVEIRDGAATALCREFLYQSPAQAGHLKGSPQSPAVLTLAEGERLECEVMRFDRQAGSAALAGPGRMIRPSRGDLLAEIGAPAGASAAAQGGPAMDTIAWKDSVEVRFGERADGSGRDRMYVQRADFRGAVRLAEGRAGDTIECDSLLLTMAVGPSGKDYPRQAEATGGVRARQGASAIQADRLTMTFEEELDAPAGRVRVRPKVLEAWGKPVRVTDLRDPAQPVEATADRVRSEVDIRRASLYGAPAKVSQGPNSLSGPEIHLDQSGESATVAGAGTLDFLTDRDLEGRRIVVPRPVAVRWTDAMEYRGAKNFATITGGVTLASQSDRMSCRTMRLVFAGRQDSTQPAATPRAAAPSTAPADAGRMTLGMAAYSRRRIEMIVADRDVWMQSERHDDQGRLAQWVRLDGSRLVYDAAKATVDVNGAGTLSVQDYRAPEPGRRLEIPRREMGLLSGQAQRPSQTVFSWDKDMLWEQAERRVTFSGNARARHRGGNQIVLAKELRRQLNLPPWPELADGRATDVSCGQIVAMFGRPEEGTSTASAPAGAGAPLDVGPTLGAIDRLVATRDVNIRDGPAQVLGQEVLYDRAAGTIEIWGYLKGTPPARASLSYEDPSTGRAQQWVNPVIRGQIENGRIVKVTAEEGAAGTGGR